jgi:hypothetical protein
LLIVRVVDRPRLRNQVAAGASIGLGISSRYFLVTLLPVLVLAGVIALRRRVPDASIKGIAAGVGTTVAAFALTTPYFFLDWSAARSSLGAENAPQVGHDGLSPLGNLRWYLGTSIPNTLSWPLALFAVAGIVLALRRPRDARRLLLLVASGIFIAALCTSKLHWERWPLPILPFVVLFAAYGVIEVTSFARARASKPILGPAFATTAVGLVALLPAMSLIQMNMRESKPSTRVIAGRWIEKHVPDGSFLVKEVKTAPLYDHDIHVLSRYSLPRGGWTIGWYERHGYRYFVINGGVSGTYLSHPRQYSQEAALYRTLRRDGCLLRKFEANSGQYGPLIRVYELPPAGSGCAPAAPA